MRLFVGTVLVLSCLASPASAVDVDRRVPDPAPPPSTVLAPLRPETRCHLVRVVPVVDEPGEESLLYRPCDPPVETPPYTPFEERPPVPIPVPVVPRR